METKDTCFYEESFIRRSFLVLEILRGAHFATPHPSTPYLMATQPKKSHGK